MEYDNIRIDEKAPGNMLLRLMGAEQHGWAYYLRLDNVVEIVILCGYDLKDASKDMYQYCFWRNDLSNFVGNDGRRVPLESTGMRHAWFKPVSWEEMFEIIYSNGYGKY